MRNNSSPESRSDLFLFVLPPEYFSLFISSFVYDRVEHERNHGCSNIAPKLSLHCIAVGMHANYFNVMDRKIVRYSLCVNECMLSF